MVGTNLRLLELRFQRLDHRERRAQRTASLNPQQHHHHLAFKRDPHLDEEVPYETRDYVSHSPRNTAPLRNEEHKVKVNVQREVVSSTTAVKQHVEQFLAKIEQSRQMLRGVSGSEHAGDEGPHQATFLTGTSLKNASRLRDDMHFAELFSAPMEPAQEAEGQEAAISRVIGSSGGGSTRHGPGAEHGDDEGTPQQFRPSTAPKRSASAIGANRGGSAGGHASSSYANANPVKLRGAPERPSTAQSHGASSAVSKMVAAFFRSMPPVVPPRPAASLPKRVFPPHNIAGGAAASAALDDVKPSPSQAIAAAARTKEFYNLQIRIVHADPDLSKWEFTVVITDVTSIAVSTPQHRFHRLRVTKHNYLIFHAPGNIVLSPCDDIPWVAGPGALYNHTLRLEVFATVPQHTKVVDTLVFYGKTPQGPQ